MYVLHQFILHVEKPTLDLAIRNMKLCTIFNMQMTTISKLHSYLEKRHIVNRMATLASLCSNLVIK